MKSITSITGFKSKGFSLIELLIVIAILAIVSSIGLLGFTAAQKRSRDANRKSDLAQFRTALESYANKNNGLYPIHASAYSTSTLCSADLALAITCPVDPKTAVAYNYISDAGGTKYVLYGTLEAPSPAANVIFGLCSTGSSVSLTAAPTIAANCP